MLIILTSPSAVSPKGIVLPDVVDLLSRCKKEGHPVAIVSNHSKPEWFDSAFEGTGVQFLQTVSRQNGAIITHNAEVHSLKPHDVIVLVANDADLQMAKNGGAVMVAAKWASNETGVLVDSPSDFIQVVQLTNNWSGAWWFSGGSGYGVRALADLSSLYGESDTQKIFAKRLTTTVKNGGPQLTALLTTTARSLLTEGVGGYKDLLWGVYPSSNSLNDDNEVLSDFTHRLRTLCSRVKMAERGQPLFIRHNPSSKRSAGGGKDRTDPVEQIETIHINPHYQKNRRLKGKNIIVIDDCTTHGVSFGVAAAFLRKAGAASVLGVALGKFGNCSNAYSIEIDSDPFSPVRPGEYTVYPFTRLTGQANPAAKMSLRGLIT